MNHRFPMAKKHFGQHFLNSPKVINLITSPLPENIDAIIEIGPGPAVLTPYLSAYKKPLHLIEMDERFIELLTPHTNQEYIYREDALAFDWPGFFKRTSYASIWLVSNLPYNISVPLTLSFLNYPQITHLTLMYQKEVAQKILPADPRNSMNSLHVLCRSQFDLSHVCYVPPGAFIPPPKVDSQVLNFKRKNNADIALEDLKKFEQFLRLIFANKRKQLGGILKNSWGSELTEKRLQLAQLNGQIRSETLSYFQVLELFKTLNLQK